MKEYTAIATNKETKQKTVITSEYARKSDFIRDLRNNGYSVNPKWVKASSDEYFLGEYNEFGELN
jgi:hypothetical protein